jgi:Family of unknown function (DUF5908)
MPVVISEIEIAVSVIPDGLAGNAATTMNNALKEEIIRECVEKVMELLRQKNER